MKLIRIIVLLFFLWFGNQTYSQTNTFIPEWAYGVNGGLTFSKVGFNSSLSIPQESFRQFSGGAVVRYISEKQFGIQVELNYSQRGWKERTDTVHLNRYSRSVSYLELPVLTHIYFNLGKNVRLIFNLGPQIGYYLSEKDIERDIVDFKQDEDNPDKPSYYDTSVDRPFDYGLKGVMGLEFRTKAGSIILDGRYYYGLSDVFNNAKGDWFQASHNQIMGVNLTYLFRK
jgi:hypothetical protein